MTDPLRSYLGLCERCRTRKATGALFLISIYRIGNGKQNMIGGHTKLPRVLLCKLEFVPICPDEGDAGVAGTCSAA
jgi:hypothetical protein